MPTSILDTGLTSLILLARYHNIAGDIDQLRHHFAITDRPFTPSELQLAAKYLDLKVRLYRPQPSALPTATLPAIAFLLSGKAIILAKIENDQVLIHDTEKGQPQQMTLSDFQSNWDGSLLQVTSRASLIGQLAHFDFTWFVPSIIKYRRLLSEVLFVSFIIQALGLATPLFFQAVTDKVLVHQGLTTLDVLAIGLVVVYITDVVLTGVRNYLFSHTTNRIDVELGSKLFRHLVQLPLSYFEARRVGDSVARVKELENIRSFLTGNAVTLVLDISFSLVFIAVMFYYSTTLTWLVLLAAPLYAVISALVTPIIRSRLNEKFNRGAENQSLLVETVSNIQTIKAMSIEPQVSRRWDLQLASYVSASFAVTRVNLLGSQAISLVNKLVMVATLWFGARLVIEGKLTMGQLIAFNMLANQVTNPIMRLAQLWQDFQQTGISVARLGDILNTRTEIKHGAQSALPPIAGALTFSDVAFRYKPTQALVLANFTLSVPTGTMLGIVGRSGSGKSTITKLLQRLYHVESGRILVDGHDINLVDPSWLRRQIGVVLQENQLFNRSIRENIAVADPGLSLTAVIAAAKLAGAHDFISALPEGYDTVLGEQGVGLSGGQRQRIAIARALVMNPRILIFDEATSALDYESEFCIQQNMKAICAGRTVIVIAHRLSAVRAADVIITMDNGKLIEQGTHNELLASGGMYAALYKLQQG